MILIFCTNEKYYVYIKYILNPMTVDQMVNRNGDRCKSQYFLIVYLSGWYRCPLSLCFPIPSLPLTLTLCLSVSVSVSLSLSLSCGIIDYAVTKGSSESLILGFTRNWMTSIFSIVNFPFLSSNIPSAPAFRVFVSQLDRYARACSNYQDFMEREKVITTKLLSQ